MARIAGVFDARTKLMSRALPRLDVRERSAIGVLRVSRDRTAKIEWVRRALMRPRRLYGAHGAAQVATEKGNPARAEGSASLQPVAASPGDGIARFDAPLARAAAPLQAVLSLRRVARALGLATTPRRPVGSVDIGYAAAVAIPTATPVPSRAQHRCFGDRLARVAAPIRSEEKKRARRTRLASVALNETDSAGVPDAAGWSRSAGMTRRGPYMAESQLSHARYSPQRALWRGLEGTQAGFPARVAPSKMTETSGVGFAPFLASSAQIADSQGFPTGTRSFSPIADSQTQQRHQAGHGVSLTGEIIIDGRQLGMVIAREQTRQASLPATRGSAVEVGAMPLYSNNSGSF